MSNSTEHVVVTDQDGVRGWVDAQALARHDQTHLMITYDGDRHVQVPRSLVQQQADGAYHVPVQLRAFQEASHQGRDAEETIIPVLQEEVQVDKRRVEVGRVQVTKEVHIDEEIVDALLKQEKVQIERIPLEQIVEQAPQIRYEGDTLVIPVVAEVLVVEKRLLLKEEIHVRKYVEEVAHQEPVKVRREEITVERTEI